MISLSRLTAAGIMMAALTAVASQAQAQQVSVQQPVFGQFSAGTTVSVPDRGRTFIGGVSRGASGRITTGPFRSPSATGFEYSHSSASAHVWIHDFEELDRQALEAAQRGATSRPDRSRPLTGMSGHAWQALERTDRTQSPTVSSGTRPRSTARQPSKKIYLR